MKTYNNKISLLQNQIFICKDNVMCLHKRLVLIKNDYALKNNFEKNEIDIIIHDTKQLIFSKNRIINELENTLQKEVENYCDKINSIQDSFDTAIRTAKELKNNHIDIRNLLYSANWKLLDENLEEKINFYYALNNLIQSARPQ